MVRSRRNIIRTTLISCLILVLTSSFVSKDFDSQLPEFTSDPIRTVNEGDEYKYGILTYDEDNDNIELSLIEGPDWLTFETDIYQVTRFAGNREIDFANGYRLSAAFQTPRVVYIDNDETFYILTEGRIRKITPEGNVETVAGAGSFGYVDGVAEEAKFRNPNDIALDKEGNIYVADTDNRVIRKVDVNGNVSTFAGTGERADIDGPKEDAAFIGPSALAFDEQGNLYVSDGSARKIKVISPEGEVSVFAGTGETGQNNAHRLEATFFSVDDIVFDSEGNMFATDIGNHVIRKIDTEGTVSTYAGSGQSEIIDGKGHEAAFGRLFGIAIDSNDIIYVSDSYSVRRVDKERNVKTIAGRSDGSLNDGILGEDSRFPLIGRLATIRDNVYVADKRLHLIRKVSKTGKLKGNTDGIFGEFNVEINAQDKDGETSQNYILSVLDNEPPFLQSSLEVNVMENKAGIIYTPEVSDNNPNSIITFSLDTFLDEHLFDIDSQSGEITFKLIPDYENPTDKDKDNVYQIRLFFKDDTGNQNSAWIDFTILDQEETSMRFGNLILPEPTPVGSTESFAVDVINESDIDLIVSDISYPDGFQGPVSLPTISGNNSFKVTLNFTPTTLKTYSGDIVFSYNGGQERVTVEGEAALVASAEEESSISNTIGIYPNPTTNYLILDLTYLNGLAADVEICDLEGRVTFLLEGIKDKKHKIDVNGYKNGVYFVKIETEKGLITKKFFIVR